MLSIQDKHPAVFSPPLWGKSQPTSIVPAELFSRKIDLICLWSQHVYFTLNISVQNSAYT